MNTPQQLFLLKRKIYRINHHIHSALSKSRLIGLLIKAL